MEIQKIFSNTEDENEKLYSVLMTEGEVAFYSEFQKEFNSKSQKMLRKAFDIKQGLKDPVIKDHIRITKTYFPDRLKDKDFLKSLKDSTVHKGRQISKSLWNETNPTKIHTKINERASMAEWNKLVNK